MRWAVHRTSSVEPCPPRWPLLASGSDSVRASQPEVATFRPADAAAPLRRSLALLRDTAASAVPLNGPAQLPRPVAKGARQSRAQRPPLDRHEAG
jgi:hypothetical protein